MVPDAETLAKYERAGKIAADALRYGTSLIKPGASMRDVLDRVERYIREQGAEPAFPAQSCVNSIAAHFCPTDAEDHRYQASDLVKLDVGVHVDGFIADNATTISLDGSHDDLCAAVREALAAAQATLRAGVTPDEVGAAIAQAIVARGFQPVRNLTGHGLARFTVHAPPTMPNVACGENESLRAGMIVAIEPFATDGTAGLIMNSPPATIFSLENPAAPVRSPAGREVLALVRTYDGLPFTTRWITRAIGPKAALGLAELRRARAIVEYPPLPEKSGGLVAQHEKTFLITQDGCRVLTP